MSRITVVLASAVTKYKINAVLSKTMIVDITIPQYQSPTDVKNIKLNRVC